VAVAAAYTAGCGSDAFGAILQPGLMATPPATIDPWRKGQPIFESLTEGIESGIGLPAIGRQRQDALQLGRIGYPTTMENLAQLAFRRKAGAIFPDAG
jgi:hypothetical protein